MKTKLIFVLTIFLPIHVFAGMSTDDMINMLPPTHKAIAKCDLGTFASLVGTKEFKKRFKQDRKYFEQGREPFHRSVFCPEIFSLLLDMGYEIDTFDRYGKTPLHIASGTSSVSSSRPVDYLIRQGANIELKTIPVYREILNPGKGKYLFLEGGETPLSLAIASGPAQNVKLLLNAGAKWTGDKELLQKATSAFHSKKKLKILFAKGPDIESYDQEFLTSLVDSASYNHPETAIYLIDRGVDVSNAKFALYQASRSGHYGFMRKLIEKGVDINLEVHNERSPLYHAADRGIKSPDIVKLLIKSGADVNYINSRFGSVALVAAAGRDTPEHTEIVRILLQNGADPNIGDKGKPLHSAAYSGNYDAAKLLLAANADKNQLNSNRETALDIALGREKRWTAGHRKIIELLSEKKHREPAIFKFIRDGDVGKFKELIKKEGNINIKNEEGDSLLHIAVYENRLKIVKFLIDSGINLELKNSQNRTAVKEAAINNHRNIWDMLVENGAEYTKPRAVDGSP